MGLGAAAEIVTKEQALTTAHMAAMRDDLETRLLRAFPQVKPTHESIPCLPMVCCMKHNMFEQM